MRSKGHAIYGFAAPLAWLLWLASPGVGAAQPQPVDIEQRLTPEQMHATGLDTLSPAQLQLLNRLLREESTPVSDAPAPVADSPAPPPSVVAEPAIAPTAVTQAASLPESAGTEPSASPAANESKPAVAPMFIGLDDQPIKSRIPGTVSGWAPGSEFLLENGQRWKVLKGEVSLPKPLENPVITVIPGVAGRWFLQVDESMPSARVYRIE
ncbi:MAG TPA: hypothetical protein VN259_01915 [Xanthomonadales bacterium]|nr:hypothetical protein [Xanthomonadales bacterium]